MGNIIASLPATRIRLYADESVPFSFIEELYKMDGAEGLLEIGVVRHDRRGQHRDSLIPVVRNLCYDDPSVGSAIVLDCHDDLSKQIHTIRAFFGSSNAGSSRSVSRSLGQLSMHYSMPQGLAASICPLPLSPLCSSP